MAAVIALPSQMRILHLHVAPLWREQWDVVLAPMSEPAPAPAPAPAPVYVMAYVMAYVMMLVHAPVLPRVPVSAPVLELVTVPVPVSEPE